MHKPGNYQIPISDSPTSVDTPTRTDFLTRAEFEAHSLKEIKVRYEVLSELGRGGMGVVLKVRDRETQDIVALKLLHPEIAANFEWEQRFKAELLLARKITHKNVCRVYELLRFGDTAAIAMEFVEGETLRQVMNRFGGLPLHKALEVTKEICGGLREAHAQGVVHRDLKPENVIIDGIGSVHVMDFGLARSAQTTTASSPDSQGISGTPEYMSPEQVKGAHADARSDIYALGLILYELLTRRSPFQADSPMGIAMKHVNDAPPAPRDIDPTIPLYVERAILKCLEKNPEKRFQNVDELEVALTTKKIKETAPAEAEPENVPLPLQLVRWHNRDSWLAGTGLAALLIFLLMFPRVTPYSTVQFLSAGEAKKVANGALEKLGFPVELTGARPVVNVQDFSFLPYGMRPSNARALLARSATGWSFFGRGPVPGIHHIELAQDGSVARIQTPRPPSWMQSQISDAELQTRLSKVAFQITHEDPSRFQVTGTRVEGMYQLRMEAQELSDNLMYSISVSASDHGFFLNHMVFNRYWEIPPSRFRGEIARAVFPLILVIGMALFFVRRLQSRPQWRVAVAAGIAMLLAFSAFRGWLEYLVTDSVMPRFVVYFWEGSTRELSGSASQTAELFLHLSFAIVLFSVLYGVGALIQYYGHRGDPARFDTLIRSVDGAAAITGLSAMRGFLAGSLVAAGLTSVLAVLEQLRWAVADASWISRALGYRWPWIHITDVNDDAFLIGWRIFALAVLDAFAILVLVGLPAAISSRISKRFTIRIGIIVVFWTAIGFSLSGMTVFGSAFVGYGCVLLQAACVALVYWRYDLLTAIFSAFVADALVLGCGAFFTFRTLDPVVHLTAIVLMTAVVLVPTLAYFRPQLLMAMRKTARVFE